MDIGLAEMMDVEIKQLSKDEILSKTEELSQKWHNEFDNKWGRESFHNWEHVRAVREAKDSYIKNYKETAIDPLNLFGADGELEKWNSNPNNTKISQDEFEEILDMAVLIHDLGNIMDSLMVGKDGELVPDYHKDDDGKVVYKAAGAEDRTELMARTMILSMDLSETYLPLLQHLIEQTKFAPKKGEGAPFAVFMRVIDQIGNDYFSNNRERVIGLVNENVSENTSFRPNQDFFINFTLRRFPQLVPDESVRSEIVHQMWRNEFPQEVEGLKNEVVDPDVLIQYEKARLQ